MALFYKRMFWKSFKALRLYVFISTPQIERSLIVAIWLANFWFTDSIAEAEHSFVLLKTSGLEIKL